MTKIGLRGIASACTLLLVGCGLSAFDSSASPYTATVDVSASTQTRVGGPARLTVNLTNTGPAIPHLGLVFLKAERWYDHHVITSDSGCAVDKSHNALDCGDLAAGAKVTYAFVGVAKDAGNYQYELAFEELVPPFDFVNDHPDGADVRTWSEAILPG